MFTTFSVPVMTRLRQAERLVLDTLVDAGVARSRSDALAWCVRLVGEHEDTWLTDLREALLKVEHVRSGGPDPDRPELAPGARTRAGRSAGRQALAGSPAGARFLAATCWPAAPGRSGRSAGAAHL